VDIRHEPRRLGSPLEVLFRDKELEHAKGILATCSAVGLCLSRALAWRQGAGARFPEALLYGFWRAGRQSASRGRVCGRF